MNPSPIYLSYSAAAAKQAESVRSALDSAGVAYVDGGTLPDEEKRTAIAGARLFVACVSPWGVAADLGIAFEVVASISKPRSWLVPLKLEPCALPPLRITDAMTFASLEAQMLDVEGVIALVTDADPPTQRQAQIGSSAEANLIRTKRARIATVITDGAALPGNINAKSKIGQIVTEDEVTFAAVDLTRKDPRS